MRKAEKNYDYFSAFQRMGEKSCQAAEMLAAIMDDFDPEQLGEHLTAMHTIEHEADMIHHEMMRHLAREFITPIEREDIASMARELDEVTDCIEDVVQRMYMYNIRQVPEEARQIAQVICRCCRELGEALAVFPQFKKNSQLQEHIIEVNRLEEDGDRLYVQGNRRLYTGGGDPVSINAWEATFTRLEKCCDACEHVADAMESIIMKNT